MTRFPISRDPVGLFNTVVGEPPAYKIPSCFSTCVLDVCIYDDCTAYRRVLKEDKGLDITLTPEEAAEFEREQAEEAAEMEEQAKAERTCVGEGCGWCMLINAVGVKTYTCNFEGSPAHGLVFVVSHRVCEEMYD